MRITLSERALTAQIRSLENIGPEVTNEEIQHRIDKYARKLFEYVAGFGVQMLQEGFRVNGTLCTMSAQLKQSWSEDDVQTRIQGLVLLAPVSISLDQQDLPAFVTNPVMLAGMSENWAAFGQSLQRVTLAELRPAIENAARQTLTQPAPVDFIDPETNEELFQDFLRRSGKRDPLARQRAIDEFNQAEIARVKAAEQKARDDFWSNRSE